jgi:hypothetical protein
MGQKAALCSLNDKKSASSLPALNGQELAVKEVAARSRRSPPLHRNDMAHKPHRIYGSQQLKSHLHVEFS